MKPVFTWNFSYIPAIIAGIFVIGASVLCSGCYTLKQGATMLGYLNRAVPLEKISEGENVSDEDLLFVQKVNDIRRFAMEELRLKESKNYTRYVELDRDYLAAVVSACAKDSFPRHEWWFPVVGRVPYKGFFNVDGARAERAKLEKKDLDVWVRGVTAFSTLGCFRDPLYSYMKSYSDRALADLIIHELLHATLYIKNHSQFNEELAEFIGSEGARLYMERVNPGMANIADNEDGKSDGAVFIAFIQGLIAELDAMYKSDIPREEKLRLKEEIIENSKLRFGADYDTMFKTENYRTFIDLQINNAYLELYRLYYEEEHYFKDLYERSGSNLAAFIAAAKTVKVNRRGNPKLELERALGLR